jgi:hypothetical protein
MGGTSDTTTTTTAKGWEYFVAASLAAMINYPLWRSAAIGQSGFACPTMQLAGHRVPASLATYVFAFRPPYKGLIATVAGMTWARAAIFYGSDKGKAWLRRYPDVVPDVAATLLPPLVVSTAVQCANQPLIRSTITIQNPSSSLPSVPAALRYLYQQGGLPALWHGTSAGILKTVPKYCCAVLVKDFMEEHVLAPIDPTSPTAHTDQLYRSATKSVVAGTAGAALTNPLDVIRNKMFQTHQGLRPTVRLLYETEGWAFVHKGLSKNMIAVAIPIACTIFFTDALAQYSASQQKRSLHDIEK